MNSVGDVMMQSAMLWGASEDASADLLFEEANSKKKEEEQTTSKEDRSQSSSQIEQTEFLTTSDLPTSSGVDPMHAVTAVINNEPIEGGEPTFNHQDHAGGGDIDNKSIKSNGGVSLMSSVNMTEYSLPEWVMGEVANVPPSWEPLSSNPPVYTW